VGERSSDSVTRSPRSASNLANVGNFDAANGNVAFAGAGNGDLASIVNTGSAFDYAQASGAEGDPGNFNIASVLGTDSLAYPGYDGTTGDTVGNFDLAAVFGDTLIATATGANGVVDILPSLWEAMNPLAGASFATFAAVLRQLGQRRERPDLDVGEIAIVDDIGEDAVGGVVLP
jgi:hypothetical protein